MQGGAGKAPRSAARPEPELAQWFSPLGSSAGRIMGGSTTPTSAGMHSASSNGSDPSSAPSGNPFGARQPEQAAAGVPDALAPSVTGNGMSARQPEVQSASKGPGSGARGTFWTSAHAAELSSSAVPERPPAREPQRRSGRPDSAAEGGKEGDPASNADPFGLFNAGLGADPSPVQLSAIRGDQADDNPWAQSSRGAPDAPAAGGLADEVTTQQQGWPAAHTAASMANGRSHLGHKDSCSRMAAPEQGPVSLLQPKVTASQRLYSS